MEYASNKENGVLRGRFSLVAVAFAMALFVLTALSPALAFAEDAAGAAVNDGTAVELASTESTDEATAAEATSAEDGTEAAIGEAISEDAASNEAEDGIALLASSSSYDAQLQVTGDILYSEAFKVLELVNEERAAVGASALKMDTKLMQTAVQRAAETSVYWSHTRPDGTLCYTAFPSYSAAAENIALGQVDAASVMDSWMNSPGHKANILNTDYASIGIAALKANGRIYWVQCFTNATATVPAQPADTTGTFTVNVLDSFAGMSFTAVALNPSTGNTMSTSNVYKGTAIKMALKYSNPKWSYATAYVDNASVTWESSDTSVATVDSDGLATCKAPGTVTLTGYTDRSSRYYSASYTFTVSQRPITASMFSVDTSSTPYTGKAITGRVSSNLEKDVDYTVAYTNNTTVGTATVTVTGIGAYKGTLSWTFSIVKGTPAYTVPTGLTATYGQTLADVKLPDGFSWANDSSTSVGNVGTSSFKLTYTPADTANYNIVSDIPVNVTVSPVTITKSMFSVKTTSTSYTGEPITGRVSSDVLVEGTDYTVTYTNNLNAGTATITIEGKGNYTGTLSYSFKINQVSIYSSMVTLGDDAIVYDGTAKEPAFTVVVNGRTLEPNVDYTFEYSNNVNASSLAKISITGKGNYKNTSTTYFTIAKATPAYTAPGDMTATLGQTLGDLSLPDGFKWAKNAKTILDKPGANTFTARLTPADTTNYNTVTVNVNVQVNGTDLLASFFKVNTDKEDFTGSAITKKIENASYLAEKLVEGTDYTVAYADNINAGTATITIAGMGAYTGTLTYNFEISTVKIYYAEHSDISTQYWAGSPLTPDFTLTYKGYTLVKDVDYDVAYSLNDGAYTTQGYIKVTGKGNFTESDSWFFPIEPKQLKVTFKSNGGSEVASTTVDYGKMYYNTLNDYINKNKPTKVGYRFAGWYFDEALTKPYDNTTSKVKATEDITLYAKWTYVFTRLYGEGRLDTMAAISEEGWESSDAVVIATSLKFADALAANALAGALDCPVLLTSPDSLSAQTAAEIERLGATRAYIAGGEGAVSAAVESQLEASGLAVERVYGAGRQATAVQIAKTTDGMKKSDTCIVAYGLDFPDALAISPYSYKTSSPIFLTEGNKKLSEDTLAAIKELGYSRAVIVGGTGVVDASVESQLEGAGVGTVERLAGAGRCKTASAVAAWSLGEGMEVTNLAVANAANFPDALAGAALCGRSNSVLVLAMDADRSCITDFVAEHRADVKKGYVFGGSSAVTQATWDALEKVMTE